jgi:phenylalanyl-tRNA synthetase beta subunit
VVERSESCGHYRRANTDRAINDVIVFDVYEKGSARQKVVAIAVIIQPRERQ